MGTKVKRDILICIFYLINSYIGLHYVVSYITSSSVRCDGQHVLLMMEWEGGSIILCLCRNGRGGRSCCVYILKGGRAHKVVFLLGWERGSIILCLCWDVGKTHRVAFMLAWEVGSIMLCLYWDGRESPSYCSNSLHKVKFG